MKYEYGIEALLEQNFQNFIILEPEKHTHSNFND